MPELARLPDLLWIGNLAKKKTSDYFLYYSMIKDENATPPFRKDKDEPEPPSMEELESMERPPPDYVQQHSDYYHHHYVGQVLTVIVNEC